MKPDDIRFCPECDSYMRFRRIPGGTTGYWECSSCNYNEGKPPMSVLERVRGETRQPARRNKNNPEGNSVKLRKSSTRTRASRATEDEDPREEIYDPAQARLNEILLQAASPLSVNQINDLVARGVIQVLRDNYLLTPAGQEAYHISITGDGPLTPEEVVFCRLCIHRPRSTELQALAEKGLITIQDGQPLLTPRGALVRTQLQEEYDRKVERSKAFAQKHRRVSRNLY